MPRLVRAVQWLNLPLAMARWCIWWWPPWAMMPMKPSPRILAARLGSAAVTVNATLAATGSALTDHPFTPSISWGCAGTIRRIASRVRPSPVTSYRAPPSTGVATAFALSVTSFMSTRC